MISNVAISDKIILAKESYLLDDAKKIILRFKCKFGKLVTLFLLSVKVIARFRFLSKLKFHFARLHFKNKDVQSAFLANLISSRIETHSTGYREGFASKSFYDCAAQLQGCNCRLVSLFNRPCMHNGFSSATRQKRSAGLRNCRWKSCVLLVLLDLFDTVYSHGVAF